MIKMKKGFVLTFVALLALFIPAVGVKAEPRGHVHTYCNPGFQWTGEKCYATFQCECGETLKLACSLKEKVILKATTKIDGKVRLLPSITYGNHTYTAQYKDFKIKKIGTIAIDKTELIYNGEKQVPKVTITDSAGNIIKKTNYTLSYRGKADDSVSESIMPGAYYVRVTLKKRYSGIKYFEYTIVKREEELPQNSVMTNLNHLCDVWSGKYFTTTGGPGTSSGDDITKNTAVASSAYFASLMGFRFQKEADAALKFPKHFANGDKSISPTAWSCAGFAAFAHWYIYTGKDTSATVSSKLVARNVDNNYAALVNLIKPGDILRYGTKQNSSAHSAIVIRIDENMGVYVLDANYLHQTQYPKNKDYNLVGMHYIPFYNPDKATTYYQVTVTGVRMYTNETTAHT